MTQKRANDLGFHITNGGRVFHSDTETEFRVSTTLRKLTESSLINSFHNAAFENGVNFGKHQKTEEIKKALNL